MSFPYSILLYIDQRYDTPTCTRHSAIGIGTGITLTVYILIAQIVPIILLVLMSYTYFITFACTFGLLYLPFIPFEGAVRNKADRIFEFVFDIPRWLGEILVPSSLSVFPFDKQSYKDYRIEQENKMLEPTPLPSKRERRLSVGMAIPQLQSSLLRKLPLEVRQMIYEEFILNNSEHRHIIECYHYGVNTAKPKTVLWGVGGNDRLQSWKSLAGRHPMDLRFCYSGREPQMLSQALPKDSGGGLTLAMTCRQVYVETMNLYYSEHTVLEILKMCMWKSRLTV